MTRVPIPEPILIRSELIVSGRLVDASNATLLCELIVDTTEPRKVVYKPIAGERPLWDFPEGTLANREVAAFKVSEFSGLKVVPATVMRDGPFGPGAVQEWIEIDESTDLIALAQSEVDELRRMAFFDCIINNTDRKFGHILITPQGEVLGCDHGVSFHEISKLRTVLWQFAGIELSDNENRVLDEFLDSRNQLSELLNPFLSSAEIEAMLIRVANLKSAGHFPYPSPDWPAIPWPPV
ncbi:MAG: SCO1664 family protein [Candidatus Nanopelagicaceae bacterium]